VLVLATERPATADTRSAPAVLPGAISDLEPWRDTVEPVRVGVVDADPVFAAQLAEALGDDPVLFVAGTATTLEQGLELARSGLDLLLVDCRLPDGGSAQLARAVRHELSGVAVVGLSSRLDRSSRLALIAEGAAGAVDRAMSLDDLAMVVREAFGGRSLRRLAFA
jgi:DNA-binding NarL/FixJ family response regulator